MIFFSFLRDDEEDEIEDTDSESGLADDVLDEIAGDVDDDEADETEGFGLIDEKEEEKKVAKAEEEDDEEEEDEASLEEDAEDVDYDTFDDVDEI